MIDDDDNDYDDTNDDKIMMVNIEYENPNHNIYRPSHQVSKTYNCIGDWLLKIKKNYQGSQHLYQPSFYLILESFFLNIFSNLNIYAFSNLYKYI